MTSIYQTHLNPLPDSEFEPGRLDHIVPYNSGRLLDPRRTPVTLVDILPSVGMFVLRIDAFEDKGALWEIPYEDVGNYQFYKNAKRSDERAVSEIRQTMEKFDHTTVIECPPEARKATWIRLGEYCGEALSWLESKSAFFAERRGLPGPEDKIGDPLLRRDLRKFLEEKDVGRLEEDFTRQFVSNPNAGEIVKGHRIVLAELGLVPYEGKISRSRNLFEGLWSRERRAEHILRRMSFVRSVFRKLGFDRVLLYRGMSYQGPLTPARNWSFVSATFNKEVAESHLEAGNRDWNGILFKQWSPVERLFMTYHETDRMNAAYEEAEAVLLYEGSGDVF